MQAWYTPKSPPLLKQTCKQASAGSFAKFCSRQLIIFVHHCGQKLLAMSAVFKITGAAASSKRTCGESRNRHQKKVGSRRRCRNAKAAPSVPPVPLTVQSLSLALSLLPRDCQLLAVHSSSSGQIVGQLERPRPQEEGTICRLGVH